MNPNIDAISEIDNQIYTAGLIFMRPIGYALATVLVSIVDSFAYVTLRYESTVSMIHSINPNIADDKVMYIALAAGTFFGITLTILPIILKIMINEHNRLSGKQHFDFSQVTSFLIGFVIYITMLNHDNSELTKAGVTAEILFYVSKFVLPFILVGFIVALSYYSSKNMILLMTKSGSIRAMNDLVENKIGRLNTETIKKQAKSVADIISEI